MPTQVSPLVSIVVPVYNAERFLTDTIHSVQRQTYSNWELILVDDCSTDSSIELAEYFVQTDTRIKLVRMKLNSGAASARNTGVGVARGRYLAFLDADDLWISQKLEIQVKFMVDEDYAFTFTSYEFADIKGTPTGKSVIVPHSLSYAEALKRSSISTITVMIDLSKIAYADIMMPNYRIGEETAVWWLLLKKYGAAWGVLDVLSYYRRGEGDTLSSNKFNAMKWRWKLYREHEKLSFVTSVINFIHYAVYAIERRV